MRRVHKKVAIVTGAASGLGAAIAERLVSEGARVIIADIQDIPGRLLAERLGCDFLPHNVTDERQWIEVVAVVEERHGALHILVNNAGNEGPFDMGDPEDTGLLDWQAIHRVNVEGAFLGCRVAIPALRRACGGCIINISSAAGLVATPTYTAYGASKAAVRHLTQSVALHCARNGSRIRCNSIHPGIILTEMLQRITAGQAAKQGISTARVLEQLRAEIPQSEFREPDDVANAVLFLVSDEARHITGLAMLVDDGSTFGVGKSAIERTTESPFRHKTNPRRNAHPSRAPHGTNRGKRRLIAFSAYEDVLIKKSNKPC